MTGRLTTMDRSGRLVSVRTSIAAEDCGALLVSNPINIRWLTGFTGSNGLVLVAADATTLITDGRYQEQAAAELAAASISEAVEVVITVADVGAELATRASQERVGFEADHVTYDRHRQATEWLPNRELVPLTDMIAALRRTKDGAERARLEAAAGIADAALAQQLPLIRPGTSERTFALALDRTMLEMGADDVSFETIVASGPNSSRPHARPTDRRFEPGDLLIVDFGAKIDGYGSDMTRTYVVGGQPSPEQQRLYHAVDEAQRAGVAAVSAGVDEVKIDEACRSTLAEHGLADAFIHGTGHGIGLEIHEQPILSPRSVGILRAGLIITVEPGAYLPSVGGVRIEDSVVVTETGCEPITHSPKGLSLAAAA